MDILLSWSSFIIIILCTIIYPLRIIIKYLKLDSSIFIKKVNYILRKNHKILGILSIILVFLHCRVSHRITNIRSGFGIFLLILLILLLLSYLLRKYLGNKWILIHRFLSLILFLGVMFHSFIEF